MASQGKFVSVNLNKSYGRPSLSSSSSSGTPANPFGNGPRSRVGGGGGGGGGMVVLSRPRSATSAGQKGGPRLAVPPPLNLPSLRKEHERFDLSAAVGRSAAPGSSGLGLGHGPSAAGWTKPVATPPSACPEEGAAAGGDRQGKSGLGDQSGIGSPGYAPSRLPSAASTAARGLLAAERALPLRGEDFPSLSATFEAPKKQRDAANQKQKQKVENEEPSSLQVEKLSLGSPLYMRPHLRTSRLVDDKGSNADREAGRPSVGQEGSRKRDSILPGPLSLPLVRLAHTSDWADDERDTGLGIPDRDRDRDRDRGLPRADTGRYDDPLEGRGPRHSELSITSSREPFRDSYGRDSATAISNREGRDASSWRAFPPSREGLVTREPGTDRGGTGRPLALNREMVKESAKYGQSPQGNSVSSGSQDPWFSRREMGAGQNTHSGRSGAESFSGKDADQKMRGRYGDLYNNRNRGDALQNIPSSRTSFSSGSKGYPASDPILNFAQDRRVFSNSIKPYMDDTGFDSRDPFLASFSGDMNMKVFKRKKDSMKQADFHDPVRESFEAELERVQQLQELERQRVLEEQARAVELARKEEEERVRLAREEEERRRKLEEEAREAAWRAEQEKLEAAKRAEEQKIAREEEKRRINMEEERRKEAARQKLMELEARIARRRAEATAKDDQYPATSGDEGLPSMVREKNDEDARRIADTGDWEDGETLTGNITSSSDFANMNRFFETDSRPQLSRDGIPSFKEKEKLTNSWRRDTSLNSSTISTQDQESGFCSPKRDTFSTGRIFSRKDFHGSPGALSVGPSSKGGQPENLHLLDDSRHSREQRWTISTEAGDHFSKSSDVDTEFFENDKFGDVGWRQNSPSRGIRSPYNDRMLQNTEIDGFSSFGRSRHSLRQPRVLPPPFSSLHRSPFRAAPERPGSSVFSENEARHQNEKGDEEIIHTRYENGYREMLRQPLNVASSEQLSVSLEQKVEKTSPRCDSQSSLSVTSPPGSPMHLSHDDLDESGDSPSMPASAHGERLAFSDSEHVPTEIDAELSRMKVSSSSASPVEDDEWPIENNEEMQDQEEYDEDDSYEEEDEVHDGDDENLALVQEFEELHSDIQNVTDHIDQLVLGYDDGVEVSIHGSIEIEKSAGTPEKEMGRQTELVSCIKESESVENLIGHLEIHVQALNAHPEGIQESSSKVTVEMVKAMQDLVMEPALSTCHPVENVTPAVSLNSSSSSISSVQPMVSSISTVPTQPEVPLKLQFGLFSGPSLIQPPVPAIQIGSIQMPLHVHPPVGPSLTQVHPPQPPFFQFGQMRYSSPIPQGMLPLAPQSMPFVHSTIQTQYSLNNNCGSSLHNQMFQDSSVQSVQSKDDSMAQVNNIQNLVSPICDVPREKLHHKELNVSSDISKNEVCQTDSHTAGENKVSTELISQLEHHQGVHDASQVKDHHAPVNNREHGQAYVQHTSCQLLSEEKVLSGTKYLSTSCSRGKRYVYKVKNSGSRSLLPAPEFLHPESNSLQRKPRRNVRRTEFRARESGRRQTEALGSSNFTVENERPSFNGRIPLIPSRNVVKKDAFLNKAGRSMADSERSVSGSSGSRFLVSEGKIGKALGKETSSKRNISAVDNLHQTVSGNLKRNVNPEEDIDAPLQSGIVRVFKQPGIVTPSDEDDFIEVRSKRQMLNDRREQREKEIKAKSRAMKTSRKPRFVLQSGSLASNSNKIGTSLGDVAKNIGSVSVVNDSTNFVGHETSTVSIVASQPLAPIGTPAISADTGSRTIKSMQTTSVPVILAGGTKLTAGLPFEKNNAASDNASTSLGTWNNERMNQQVISLTHTQVGHAMKPPHFDTHVTSIGDHHGIVIEPGNLSTSIKSQEKHYSSSANSLNSVFPGEKIQFGAVTSPILPPVSRAVSRMSAPDKECPIFFEKEKHHSGSSVHLDDPEAEAEAAASAVAVAAISNDEVVGNGLGGCDVSVSDAKNFEGSREVSSQSAAEESLTVALPADLSVETPSLSMWPPLPSPQSSGPMMSHFPGAPPSHFPCFEMNPMLGGPIFAFGPNDESVGTQSQQQRSTTLGTGPLGAWPACHSGVDSFYGPPAGYTGPFISPPVGIPGVQGPPHMVVYNHFTPVGQFGQLGLGFMGATYIPSGKQPDWKHNSVAPNVGVSEGDSNNINAASVQRGPPGMPSSIQHLAPGSSLMPMASPLTMFDMSPFQSSADIPVQARWSHLPAPPIHSVPLSVPLQQYQVDGVSPQFSHSLPSDSAAANIRFHEPRSSMPLDGGRNFGVSSDAGSQFPDELGLVETPRTISSTVQTSRPNAYSSSAENNGKGLNASRSSTRETVVSNSEHGGIGTSSSSSNDQNMGSAIKPPAAQPPTSSTQQYLQTVTYPDQKGGGSSAQKMGSGGEWYRRTGFQGKNQTSGSDKNFATAKMKQIYVAKPPASGNATAS